MGIPVPVISGLLSLGEKVLTRIWPDAEEREKNVARLKELEHDQFMANITLEGKLIDQETQIALGQADINKEDSKSMSLFRGGWRPFAGWICGAAITVQFVLKPLVAEWWTIGDVAIEHVITLFLGLAGLATQRMFERFKGVAKG